MPKRLTKQQLADPEFDPRDHSLRLPDGRTATWAIGDVICITSKAAISTELVWRLTARDSYRELLAGIGLTQEAVDAWHDRYREQVAEEMADPDLHTWKPQEIRHVTADGRVMTWNMTGVCISDPRKQTTTYYSRHNNEDLYAATVTEMGLDPMTLAAWMTYQRNMTVGKLRRILAESDLSDDTPVLIHHGAFGVRCPTAEVKGLLMAEPLNAEGRIKSNGWVSAKTARGLYDATVVLTLE